MVDKTGGVMVMSDSFAMHVFKQSLTRLFDPDQEGYLSMGFNARIEVVTSRDCRVIFLFSNSHRAYQKPNNTETNTFQNVELLDVFRFFRFQKKLGLWRCRSPVFHGKEVSFRR